MAPAPSVTILGKAEDLVLKLGQVAGAVGPGLVPSAEGLAQVAGVGVVVADARGGLAEGPGVGVVVAGQGRGGKGGFCRGGQAPGGILAATGILDPVPETVVTGYLDPRKLVVFSLCSSTGASGPATPERQP